ncbi:cysteine desulfurase [Leucobacter sp. cx-328]|uniref:cysteine desulfurase family protein n=1 Tax=unclassified Leucobacter TaxID=2621730 RepID=UPI00165E1142|nr:MULTISPECIES: cysteine desulfurase family protein [unclassified Leucobacter]MBC9944412.1 cysteine desulfurase [Leucobacter sp. cx-328]
MLDLNDTAPGATEGASAYLDHASTSPMPDEVLAAYARALQTVGNPASTHSHGQRASEALESARERIAVALGCGSAELVLTGGGTESINLALKGGFWARQGRSARPVMLVADGEHHATIEAAEWLRDEQGAIVRWLPIDAEGRLAPETLAAAIAEENAGGADRVALISFLWANNEVGTVQPVKELCAIAQAADIPVHVDAVAALGQIPVSLRDSGANLMSVSAHKIGGPMGVGALVVDRRLTVSPLFHGGSQQRGRSGTQDVAGAIAFARAIELSLETDGTPRTDRIARLTSRRDQLIAGVRAIDPTAVLRGADPAAGHRLAGSAHFTFPGCQGDSLVFLLDSAGVSVSVGSACRAGVAEVSHVLLAMGLPENVAAGALRLTLSPDTAVAEIDAFLAALPIAIERARVAGFV